MRITEVGKRAIICGVATSLVASGTQAAFAATPSTSSLSGTTKSAVTLADKAGFAHINKGELTKTTSVTVVPLTPALAVTLEATHASALTSKGVTINGKSADGSVTVVKTGGFGIVTNRHANIEYRYKIIKMPGTKLVKAADGGIDQLTNSGQFVGHIDPAYAIDSTGTKLPASYRYDPATNELVVKANTTAAKGAVFIDPSWRCWVTASAYGAAWVLAVAAWVFTDGAAWWVAWALRAWFGLSYNAADAVARACALH